MWFKDSVSENDGQWKENLSYTLKFLIAWFLVGTLALIICALTFLIQNPTRVGYTKGLESFCHGALLSLAFGAIGGLVGFLFGIPRQSRSSDAAAPKADGKKDLGSSNNEQRQPQESNTNLEQVSDWLTKIILGAGLTQLVKLPGKLRDLGEYFKNGFDGSSLLPILIVMNSLVFGFFAGYLLTQLFLAQALKKAQDALRTVKTVLNTAGNLEQLGKFGAAAATLESALSTLRPETPVQTKRAVYERLTYNALYEQSPDGFLKVIRYAEQYIQEEPNNPSARIWAYLAAAYGQKYKWDQQQKASQETLEQSRKRALEAASKSIELESQMKGLLRMLWNPNDPTKFGSEEDDLEVFYDDPEFKKLLGE